MRTFLLVVWLMVPVIVGAWHYGPGQEHMLLDDVAAVMKQADQYVAQQEWAEAVERYDEALRMLPAERSRESRRIRLERAKAQMFARNSPRHTRT
jgi:hypothetical protein